MTIISGFTLYPLKMVIFHSYVSLPEGRCQISLLSLIIRGGTQRNKLLCIESRLSVHNQRVGVGQLEATRAKPKKKCTPAPALRPYQFHFDFLHPDNPSLRCASAARDQARWVCEPTRHVNNTRRPWASLTGVQYPFAVRCRHCDSKHPIKSDNIG